MSICIGILILSDAKSAIIFEKAEISIYRTILHDGRRGAKNQILIHEESTGNTLQNLERKEMDQLILELGSSVEIFEDWEKKNISRRSIAKSLEL